MSSEYVTKKEVADHFAVASTTVDGWIRKKGLLPPGTFIKVGRTYRFKLKELEEHFLQEAQRLAGTEPEEPEEGAPVQLELPFDDPEEVEELEDEIPSFDFDADDDV